MKISFSEALPRLRPSQRPVIPTKRSAWRDLRILETFQPQSVRRSLDSLRLLGMTGFWEGRGLGAAEGRYEMSDTRYEINLHRRISHISHS